MSLFFGKADAPTPLETPDTPDAPGPREAILSLVEVALREGAPWSAVRPDLSLALDNLWAITSARVSSQKVSPRTVPHIRQRRKDGDRVTDLAKAYSCDRATISRICRGITFAQAGGPILGIDYEKPKSNAQEVVKGKRSAMYLSEQEIFEITAQAANGMRRADIARHHGISSHAVGRIIRREATNDLGQ